MTLRRLSKYILLTAACVCAVILSSCGNVDSSGDLSSDANTVSSDVSASVTKAEQPIGDITQESTPTQTDTAYTNDSVSNAPQQTSSDKAQDKPSGNTQKDPGGAVSGKEPAQTSSATGTQRPAETGGTDVQPPFKPAEVLPAIDSREVLIGMLKEDRFKAAARIVMQGVEQGNSNIVLSGNILKISEIEAFMPFISMLEAESYVTPLRYTYTYDEISGYVTGIKISNYSKTTEEYNQEKQAVQKLVKSVVAEANKSCATQYDKVIYFHDYIVKNCVYDNENQGVDVASAYGCLINKKAVCEGYSKAMMLLCNEAGIKCTLVTGNVQRNGEDLGHMWNMINIDGVWAHVDVTWDDVVVNDENLCCYSYFGLTDRQILTDHNITELSIAEPIKAESTAADYHIKKGCYINSQANVSRTLESAVDNSVKNGSQIVSLRCADDSIYSALYGMITSDVYKYVNASCEKYGRSVKSVRMMEQKELGTIVIILNYNG